MANKNSRSKKKKKNRHKSGIAPKDLSSKTDINPKDHSSETDIDPNDDSSKRDPKDVVAKAIQMCKGKIRTKLNEIAILKGREKKDLQCNQQDKVNMEKNFLKQLLEVNKLEQLLAEESKKFVSYTVPDVDENGKNSVKDLFPLIYFGNLFNQTSYQTVRQRNIESKKQSSFINTLKGKLMSGLDESTYSHEQAINNTVDWISKSDTGEDSYFWLNKEVNMLFSEFSKNNFTTFAGAFDLIDKRIKEIKKKEPKGKMKFDKGEDEFDEAADFVKALDNIKEELLKSERKHRCIEKLPERYSSMQMVEGLLKMVYFCHLIHDGDAMSVQKAKRNRKYCLKAVDDVSTVDLDNICKLNGLITSISSLGESRGSHKQALDWCFVRARLWLERSNSNIRIGEKLSYSEVKLKLDKIMGSKYYTTAKFKLTETMTQTIKDIRIAAEQSECPPTKAYLEDNVDSLSQISEQSYIAWAQWCKEMTTVTKRSGTLELTLKAKKVTRILLKRLLDFHVLKACHGNLNENSVLVLDIGTGFEVDVKLVHSEFTLMNQHSLCLDLHGLSELLGCLSYEGELPPEVLKLQKYLREDTNGAAVLMKNAVPIYNATFTWTGPETSMVVDYLTNQIDRGGDDISEAVESAQSKYWMNKIDKNKFLSDNRDKKFEKLGEDAKEAATLIHFMREVYSHNDGISAESIKREFYNVFPTFFFDLVQELAKKDLVKLGDAVDRQHCAHLSFKKQR